MDIKDVERKPFEYVSYGPDYVAPTHMRKLPANEVVQRRVPLMPPTAIIADSSFRQAPQLIRMMLHRFALHEADECLLLDGKRITEVHNER